MNIRTLLGMFTSSLKTEVQLNIDMLERQLIQRELAAIQAESDVMATQGKLEYLRAHSSVAQSPTETQ